MIGAGNNKQVSWLRLLDLVSHLLLANGGLLQDRLPWSLYPSVGVPGLVLVPFGSVCKWLKLYLEEDTGS